MNQENSSSNEPKKPPQGICDVVMKGGITSGVVYPRAVCVLSKTYRFKNVGGTSAGAIAAAATAAAEHGRKNGHDGFEELSGLPRWLGERNPSDSGKSNLRSLFSPQESTRPLFNILMTFLGPSKGRVRRAFTAALWNFPAATLLGLLPGLVLLWLAFPFTGSILGYWSLVCGILLALVGAVIVIFLASWRRAAQSVPDNFFGLCKGLGGASQLTDWLTDLLDRLAGKEPGSGPLTFGDLWGSNDPEREREINLQLMTTNLSHGRPLSIPFEKNIFYFDRKEFRTLFPEKVVRWMENHPRNENGLGHPGLCQLPDAAQLPVVVAVRLSLSFPLLLSAVPLFAFQFVGDFENDKKPVIPKPERCWFSDGGICSNFPVHFFDQAIPTWPTFAINLRALDNTFQDGVWMPETNNEGLGEWWNKFDTGTGHQRFVGFFGAIIETMQNWMDNTQTKMPGYRDRVAHVGLSPDEGGLNLDMPAQVITNVANRGERAAEMLVKRFAEVANPPALSWDNHRWIRYRSTMTLIEDLLRFFIRAYKNPMHGDRTYAELITRSEDELPKSYPWKNQNQRSFAASQSNRLVDLAELWVKEAESFAVGTPRPRPIFRIMPRI